MTTINLKDYYPWYLTNEYIEVSDEVAAELRAGKLAEAAHAERVRYNKSYYSLDCDDGIEYSACVHAARRYWRNQRRHTSRCQRYGLSERAVP